jgi:hypothetical protein
MAENSDAAESEKSGQIPANKKIQISKSIKPKIRKI